MANNVVGNVKVVVEPVARDFHNKLDKQINNDLKKHARPKIPVEVELEKIDETKRKIDLLREKAGEGFELNLKVDVDEAARDVDDFINDVNRSKALRLGLTFDEDASRDNLDEFINDYDGKEINMELHIDTLGAFAQMQAFQAMHEVMVTHLVLDWAAADNEFKDFAKKFSEPLKQAIIPDFGSSSLGGAKRASALRDNFFLDPDLQASNFAQRVIEAMKPKLIEGFNDIYTPYLRGVGQLQAYFAKPLQEMGESAREARTFAQLFKNISGSIKSNSDHMSFGIVSGTKKALTSLKNLRKGLSNDESAFKKFTNGIRDSFAELGNLKFPGFISSMGTKVKPILSGMRDDVVDLKNNILNLGYGFEVIGFKIRGKVSAQLQEFSGRVKKLIPDLSDLGEKLVSAGERGLDFLSDKFENLSFVAKNAAADAMATGELLVADIGRGIARGWQKVGFDLLPIRAMMYGTQKKLQAFGKAVADNFDMAVIGPTRRAGALLRDHIGRAVDKAFPGDGDSMLRRVSTRFGRAIGGTVSRAFNNVKVLGRFAKGFGGTLVRGLGSGLKTAGSFLANNKAIYSGLSFMFGRITKYTRGFSKAAGGAFAQIAGVLGKAIMPFLMAVVAGFALLGGQAILGGVLALGGALMTAAQGAMLLAPAMIAVAGVSFAALKIGLQGVGEGVKSAFSAETTKEFEESISKLPASVQSIARAFREFKGPMDEMKRNVQDNMLAGLAPKITSAMNNLFPTFKSGLEGIGKAWNGAFKRTLDEFSSAQAQRGLKAAIGGAEEMAKNMEPVLANLIAAFGSLVEQGAKFLGPIGKYFADASESFKNWAESLKELDPTTGMSKFDSMIALAAKNASLLKDILGGALGAFGNLLYAAATGGGGILAGMATAMQDLKKNTEEGTAGYAKMHEFFVKTTAVAQQLGSVVGPIFSAIGDLAVGLMTMAEQALPGVSLFLQSLANSVAVFSQIGEVVGKVFNKVFESFAPIANMLGNILAPLVAGLAGGIGSMLIPLGEVLGSLAPKLAELAQAMMPALIEVGGAIGKIFTAISPMVGSFITLLADMMPVLSKIFFFIGEIAAAIINAITPLFAGKDSALGKIFDLLMPIVDILGNQLLNIINALAPVFPIISQMIVSLITALEPIIPLLGEIIARVGQGLVQAIQILVPHLPMIADLFAQIVNVLSAMLVPALKMLIAVWDAIWPVIVATVKFLVDEVVAPLIYVMIELYKKLSDAIVWAFENVIFPVFNFFMKLFKEVGEVVIWVIDNVLKPGMDRLQDNFRKAVDAVGNIWNGLKRLFADPIKFFIDVVINDGVIKGWNFVNKALGGKLGEMQPINSSNLSFAQGGVLPGYTPGRDPHKFFSPTGGRLELSGGEAVMRPEWTRAVGGPAAVEKMNRDAKQGKLKPSKNQRATSFHDSRSAAHALGGVIKLADGGIIAAMTRVVQEKYPMLQMTSGLRPGSGYHGRGMAADFSNGSGNTPAQLALAQDIATTYPGSAQLIYDAPGWAGNIANGQNVGAFGGYYNLAEAGPHHHHVHWAMTTPPTMPFGGGVFEGGSDGGGGMLSRMVSWFSSKFEPVFNPIKEKILGQAEGFDPGWGIKTAVGLANKALDATISWAKDQLKDKFDFLGGGGSESVDLSGVSGEVQEVVRQVFERHGFSGQQWEDAAWIIGKESSWNPNAVNPSSGAFGLFQFNPMGGDTLGQYLPSRSTDPAVQADAGARYIKDRYGNPTAARRFWEANNWYDNGGIANGIGLMQKMTLRPERVLSPAQTKAFDDLVYRVLPTAFRQATANPWDLKGGFERAIKTIEDFRSTWQKQTRENVSNILSENFYQRQNGKTDTKSDMSLVVDAIADPWNYLQAESEARTKLEERLDKEREEAKKSEEDALKDKQEAEDKERKEREKAEDEAAKTDEEKEALKKSREEAREAEKEKRKAEDKALRDKQAEEDKAIEEKKASGEYYYGFKTLGDDASNPHAYQPTEHETLVRDSLTAVAEPLGLGGVARKAGKWYDIGRQLEAGAKVAGPAWAAALNGDPSALAHNIAASDAALREEAMNDMKSFIPMALGGLTEMAMASGATTSHPFIGTVNTGLTQAELFDTLTRYEKMQARSRTGTMRTR